MSGDGLLFIPNAVVVEGKYDRNRLSGVIDAFILTTNGFSLFNEKQKEKTLCRLAAERPVIVLTDSDSAGMMIRKRITSVLGKDKVVNLYTPQIEGKERRKARPSKEGFLGVEGIENRVLRELFVPFAEDAENAKKAPFIDRGRLYADGLFGGKNSASLRKKLLSALDLPEGLSAGDLIDVLNLTYTENDYISALKAVTEEIK